MYNRYLVIMAFIKADHVTQIDTLFVWARNENEAIGNALSISKPKHEGYLLDSFKCEKIDKTIFDNPPTV